jgi:D-alanyl-D-alanine carboxypeptidase (penicillin-binding protein 5/6)
MAIERGSLVSRIIFLALWLLAAPWAQAGALHDPLPAIAHAYLVELDGKALWAHQPQRRLPAASLDKLMVALLLVEQQQLDAPVTIRLSTREGSGLRSGEIFRTRDLLAALLIASDDTACHTLAAAGGSEAAFVRQMNRRAQQLGMRDTHYANACGHDAPQQHTSAHDLLLLAHELLRHPEITALTARRGARIATLDGRRSFSFSSRNALLNVPGVRGLKTGYTKQAGRCQLIYAERDGHKVLLAILHGTRWNDAAGLLELAFDQAQHPG